MSATEATAPHVAQHAGYVEPSETFAAAHSDKTAEPVEDAKGESVEPSPPERTGTTEEKVGKDEVKVTATPVTNGVLGYKAPGLISQLRFKKHYFWLGDEAVPSQDLSQYLRGEKPEVSHSVAAWSSQTGKGLLFFSKDENAKKTPVGVLNLADATDVAKDGNEDFSFKIARHRHIFQAKDNDERNGFVVAIEQASKQAAESRESIQNSEGYKGSLKQLEKPGGLLAASATAGGAATAATASHSRKDDETPRQKSESSDEGKKAKSRSQSRGKRGSIFGMFDKKDPKKDEKKEEKKEEKAEEKAVKAEAKAEKEEAKSEEKAEKAAAAEAKKEEKAEEKAEKKEAKEEKKEEKAEEKAEKQPEKKDHKHDGEVAAAAAGTAGAGAAIATEENKKESKLEDDKKAESSKDTTERSKSNKRRSIFGGIFDKAKSPTSEKKESDVVPAVESSKPKETPKEEWSLPTKHENVLKPNSSAEAKAVSEAFKDDPTEPSSDKENVAKNVATPTSKPAAAASSTTPANEKRRSFFGSMKKDRKTDESEASGDGESPKQKQSTPSKFGELFRRPSKAASKVTEKKEDKKSTNTPATVLETAEDTGATKSTAAPTAIDGAADSKAAVEKEAKKEGEPKPNGASIGDVVPEAVTVGQAQTTSGSSPAQVSTAA